MSIRERFARWLAPQPKATRSAYDNFWYTDPQTGFKMPAGLWFGVTDKTALQVTAVLACVRVLAETIASLPLHVYHRLPNGGKKRAPDHPLYKLLHSQPNNWQTSMEWREMLQGHLCLRGNGYAQKIIGPRGSVDQLIPLHPDKFKRIEQLETGQIKYTYQPDGQPEQIFGQQDLFHPRGLSSDGIMGLSIIALAADTIGLTKSAELFGSRFFSNGAKASGVITHPGTLSATAHENLQTSIRKQIAGENVHGPLILEEDMKWHQLSIAPDDAQFLETRKFQVNDIARIFRIPPHMIGDLERATFSNIEHQSLDFVIHTIRPWLVRWEQAISRDLIADEEYFAEFLVDGLLRGDIKSRYEAYGLAIRDGHMSRNEVRILENRNPEEGLDEFLVPMNMSPAGEELPEEPQEKPGGFKALFEDAAERLANAEIRTIEKRVPKAEQNKERFDEWIRAFYESHAGYIEKTLTPISVTVEEAGHPPLPVKAITQELVSEGIDAFANNPADALTAWKDNRKEGIVILLSEVIENAVTNTT